MAPDIADHEPSEFCFCHCNVSKFPSFETLKTTLEDSDPLIHEPNFEAFRSKSSLGLEAKPE